MSSMGRDRNFACRVHDECTFRGLNVVVMENEFLRIGILADKGTEVSRAWVCWRPLAGGRNSPWRAGRVWNPN